MLILEIFNY